MVGYSSAMEEAERESLGKEEARAAPLSMSYFFWLGQSGLCGTYQPPCSLSARLTRRTDCCIFPLFVSCRLSRRYLEGAVSMVGIAQ